MSVHLMSNNIRTALALCGQENEGEGLIHEDIIDGEVVVHGPQSGKTTRGIESFKEIENTYSIAYPDAQMKIEDVIAQNDKVVIRWNWTGTHMGKYRGIAPTYKKINIQGVHVYRFSHAGKVVEIWANHDRMGELEQLGLFSTDNRKQVN